MNSVHDMGGMQGFGPVVVESDEPPFHHGWERRVLGMTLGMAATKSWSQDELREALENLPPATYLASTYYEKWFERLQRILVSRGLVSAAEIAQGRSLAPPVKLAQVLSPERVPVMLANRLATRRPATAPARFSVGDTVRTRNQHPSSHTRLPAYCRDKPGKIDRVRGVHVFPDSNALRAGENPQWLYSVRFEAAALWGSDTTADAVYVDCFEPYLEAR